jgi:hypothetical protein
MKKMGKFKVAFLSGLVSGVLMDIFDYTIYLILKAFGIKHILYADYMVAALLQGKPSANAFEFISGQFFHLIFTGTIGCLYIYIITRLGEKNDLFKGWLIGGIGVWFVAFMIGVLYKIELYVAAEMLTVICDFFTASLYGIILSVFYNFFEAKL